MLSSTNNNLAADHITEIWNKEVSLKVSLFAWRLLRNRLPTTDNLVKRQILQPNAQLCVGGCGMMEDANTCSSLVIFLVNCGMVFLTSSGTT